MIGASTLQHIKIAGNDLAAHANRRPGWTTNGTHQKGKSSMAPGITGASGAFIEGTGGEAGIGGTDPGAITSD